MTALWNPTSIKQALPASILEGKCCGNRLCIDSRTIQPLDIFVALKGTNTDGHKYLGKAFESGASCALVEYIPKEFEDKGNFIIVPNVKEALVQLAEFNQARSNATIIAITGSVGKTSTKEALSIVCQAAGQTFCSSGNFNNDLGLPITMASMPLDTQYGIFELGMNHAGEIEALTKLARPDIAVITTIESVHLEYFKSVEDIARAKGEIFLGMNEDGIAVLNGDNKYYSLLASLAKDAGIKQIFSFGTKPSNDGVLIDYYQQKHLVKASIFNEKIEYALKAYGRHQALNTIAVLTVAKLLKLDLQASANALEKFSNLRGRGEISELKISGKRMCLIDDSYNASPASMKAALQVIKNLHNDFIKRKIIVLADMYELGPESVQAHVSLLEPILESGANHLITVGELMKNLFDAAPKQIKLAHFENYNTAKEALLNLIEDCDCILFKGSHGSKIYEVVQHLKEQSV